MSDTIELSFVSTGRDAIELCSVRYRIEGTGEELLSVRGKTAGAYGEAGSFQWTAAVQGACAIFLTTVMSEKGDNRFRPFISGYRASLAASFDYALAKKPAWISDMFGVMTLGALRAKRLFLITNSNRKRPGPVVVALNTRLLPADGIRVLLDDREVKDLPTLQAMTAHLLAKDEESVVDALERKVA